jgi:hypothetical protein
MSYYEYLIHKLKSRSRAKLVFTSLLPCLVDHYKTEYPISWEAFLDPSDSYFLFADLVGFYTH